MDKTVDDGKISRRMRLIAERQRKGEEIMNQNDKSMMSERILSEEKHRNYCDVCRNCGTQLCESCQSGYDGVPDKYKFELASKTHGEIREEILEQARICVCTDRKEQYGEAEDSFRCIADLWNAYLRPVYPDIAITPMQASMMMALFKAARDAVAKVHKIDTYVDMCGYTACAGAMAEDAG